ncbi:co-chaperone DjlA [Morganella psychrotolerans]|uniref:Co-chaperone protein DjlA n=1 Tax=Morganella psychrotolerans TaxID=368603 RepID=A0A1B8HTI2_9GAMM|nr:co-chaperone DjlA [Morganella psychrotolerans]OBU13077.1 molecular chaperone DjlA [Morganella psychrotolerans]
MHYLGKIIGILLGMMSGAGFWGVFLGFLIGHAIDKVRSQQRNGSFTNNQSRQALFFITTFQILGHLTKSKGRVTESDIYLATALMDRMQLHGDSRIQAQNAFREGKSAGFPLRDALRQLRRACYGRADLLRMFLEIQIQAAFGDGELHPNERQVLLVIAEELGIARHQFETVLAMMQGQMHRGGQGGYQQYSQQGGYHTQGADLAAAFRVLGVQESDDSTVIKRAYRKLMSEHHPDKLVAKGLPPEMMELAKEKAQSIQAAYDLIKKEKGFK